MRRTKAARPARGSLFVIIALLLASAALRIGSEAGQALAREAPIEKPGTSSIEKMCESEPDFPALMRVFKEREQRILKQEKDLRNRAQALLVTDEEVALKLVELKQAEMRLNELIAIAETAAEDDLTRLTKVYETMKPKEAAAVFEQMAPEFAAGFVGRMRPESAANVMSGLSPEAAYTISVILAGRNANAPTQ